MSFVGKYNELSNALNALYLKQIITICNQLEFKCKYSLVTYLQYSLKLSIVNGVRIVATEIESWCRDASSSSAPAMYVLVGASTSSRLNQPINTWSKYMINLYQFQLTGSTNISTPSNFHIDLCKNQQFLHKMEILLRQQR